MTTRHILYFLTIAIFWGGSFLGIHYVVESMPPAFGALMRVLVAFILACVLTLFKKNRKTERRVKIHAYFSGFFTMGLAWIFLFYGEKFISPALSSIYNSTSTIFTAIFTPIILSHIKMTRKNLLGVVIGFFGILTVFMPNVSAGGDNYLKGQLAVLAMALCYGIGVTWVKRFGDHISASENLFYQLLGAGTILTAYTCIVEHPWTIDFAAIPIEAYISVIYLATCSTFIAWLLFIRLIRERGAVQAAAVTYLMPLISIILDRIVLGRTVGPTDIIGAVIILAGVWLIQSPKFAKTVD